MGANVYLMAVDSFGNSREGAASVIIKNIPGRPGERIAIKSYSFYGGSTAVDFYFMQVIGSTTLLAATASGGSILNLTAHPISSNALLEGDFVCVVQDNGVYHFSEVGGVLALSVITLCTVLTGAAAIGRAVYDFGVYTDAGHHAIAITATTETTKELDGGFLYGKAKGYPMMLFNLQAVTTAAQVRNLAVDYLNK